MARTRHNKSHACVHNHTYDVLNPLRYTYINTEHYNRLLSLQLCPELDGAEVPLAAVLLIAEVDGAEDLLTAALLIAAQPDKGVIFLVGWIG